MMFDFDNMDVIIGNENDNPIERKLANTIEGAANHYELNSHPRSNSSEESEFRGFSHENKFLRQDDFLESMETFTKNHLRLSQEMHSVMSIMQSSINKAINSVIAERVIPQIQNMVSSIS